MNGSLIYALQDSRLYDHEVESFSVIETHISWVILTGHYAYKIKKPVNFGFLDFSTLDKRHYFCQQELELNRRFAPDLYLSVVAIGGTPRAPRFGVEPAIEYALKMREFRQHALMSVMAANDELTVEHGREIASVLAAFHRDAQSVDQNNPFGEPETIIHWVDDNFKQIEPLLDCDHDKQRLAELQQWSQAASQSLSPMMAVRKQQGFVRDCHGDLHLGNIAYINKHVVFFDCIEFSQELRFIDVLNEVSFVAMDLKERGYAALSWLFLNHYLQITGDYSSLSLYRYYYVYRALVRAKVVMLLANEDDVAEEKKQSAQQDYRTYIDLARRETNDQKAGIVLMHGFSGCGKSTVAERLASTMGAIHIRSDIERKRMFDLKVSEKSYSELNQGIYSRQASSDVYERMAGLAEFVIACGYSVIVDATFLKSSQREHFRSLARRLSCAFQLVSVEAPVNLMKQRISVRKEKEADPSEADEMVLLHQLDHFDSLTDEEQAYTSVIDNSDWVSDKVLLQLAKTIHKGI